MKLFRVPFNSLVILLLTLSFFHLNASNEDNSKYLSIEELAKNGLLRITISGSGGHTAECIQMEISNPTGNHQYARIEPGRILGSIDTNTQDIIITREEILALAPGEMQTLSIYGFCSQSQHGSPDAGEYFNVGKMGDTALVSLAEFLNEKGNSYPVDAMQQAVWCLTNDHALSDIFDEDLASIADLRNFVADLKGIKTPWYSVEKEAEEGEMVPYYTKSISGQVEVFIPTYGLVDVYICDSEGKVFDVFEENERYDPGAFEYSFRLTVVNWPRGTYYFCIRMDGNVIRRLEFEI